MKKIKFTFLFLLTFILFNCSEQLSDEKISKIQQQENQIFNVYKDYETGWVRIKFNQLDKSLNTKFTRSGEINTGIEALDEVAAALGATQIERVFNEGGKFKERREKYGLHL